MSGQAPAVRVFVYGTLKRGCRNHSFCEGGRMLSEARVGGLLYDLPQGYPALVVPEENVLAVGTLEYRTDARRTKVPGRGDLPESGGAAVHGELYAFDDPEQRLPLLDRLEGFDPDDPSSPYRRVLVPVALQDGGVTPAWAYAAPRATGIHLPGGRWPA